MHAGLKQLDEEAASRGGFVLGGSLLGKLLLRWEEEVGGFLLGQHSSVSCLQGKVLSFQACSAMAGALSDLA